MPSWINLSAESVTPPAYFLNGYVSLFCDSNNYEKFFVEEEPGIKSDT
jgi:hypothetical protein